MFGTMADHECSKSLLRYRQWSKNRGGHTIGEKIHIIVDQNKQNDCHVCN